uniref:Hemagglutinin protein n=1 Tax=Ganwon-do negev-like virus 1 TaxID=2789888 RepID=A0A7S8WJT3_9VIRU|nr:hemagglutinin protein [Ganwon-do negev-like virus 1]
MNKLLFLLLLIFFTNQVKNFCLKDQCKGPFIITEPKRIEIKTKFSTEDLSVKILPQNVEAYIGMRKEYQAYCYDGTSIDPNTGCYKKFVDHPPDLPEMEHWIKTEKCYIGDICRKGGSCTGDDAYKYCNTAGYPNEVSSSDFKEADQTWYIFATHTCVRDWTCKFHKTTLPVLWRYVDGDFKSVVPLPSGQMVKTGDRLHKIDEMTVMVIGKLEQTREFPVVKASCFYQTEQHEKICIIQDIPGVDEEIKGSVVKFDSRVHGMNAIVDNVLYRTEHFKSNERVKEANVVHDDDIAAAASIPDVKKVLNNLYFLNMDMNFDVVQLYNKMVEIEGMLITLIKSASKIDDELLGNVMGVPAKTEWVNEEYFKMCRCLKIGFDMSNCFSHWKYENGRVRMKKENETCTTLNTTASGINLFSTPHLILENIRGTRLIGTSGSLEGWTWLANTQSEMIKSIQFANDFPARSDWTRTLANLPAATFGFWFDFAKYSSFIAYLALILSVVSLCRR